MQGLEQLGAGLGWERDAVLAAYPGRLRDLGVGEADPGSSGGLCGDRVLFEVAAGGRRGAGGGAQETDMAFI